MVSLSILSIENETVKSKNFDNLIGIFAEMWANNILWLIKDHIYTILYCIM